MHPAIRVDNLSKLYRIGAKQNGYKTLRETVAHACTGPIRRIRQSFAPKAGDTAGNGDGGRLSGENFWALKDVSFEVQPGEVVGIIGRNGAGKSTLLKILSRITEPTHGRVELRGRVGSLLEVGTGFHPELTGRENVYMNGSILGMSHREISRKFDEIVEFSGIEDFLDTPVKRYSSGMYVRLAFAVAAHLEPEILVVDEVLAVGDVAFQAKCLRKIRDIAQSGSTVLFVSHNLGTVKTFCTRVYWLSDGSVAYGGPVSDAVRAYLASTNSGTAACSNSFERPRGAQIWMSQARVHCGKNDHSVIETGDDVTLEIGFEAEHPLTGPKVGFAICSQDGVPLISSNNHYQSCRDLDEARRAGVISCRLGPVPLLGGRYSISLWLGDETGNTHHVDGALWFDVSDRDIWGMGRLPTRYGFCWWPTQYEVGAVEPDNGADGVRSE